MKAILVQVAAGMFLAAGPTLAADPPRPVRQVNLEEYVGLWYEIARVPNRFQKSCDRNVTAKYTLQPDGRVEVINRCTEEDGKVKEARGTAKVMNAPQNSQLEVSFVRFLGMNLFWGDYWVLGLGEDYGYAVVGHPERKYGWILSRTRSLESATLEAIFELLRDQGYDPAEFVFTPQTG
jgi:apolipoprotein D and lipocalin family protein